MEDKSSVNAARRQSKREKNNERRRIKILISNMKKTIWRKLIFEISFF